MQIAPVRALALLICSSAALANPAHNQIHAMSEATRQTFMANYLTASGEKCASVDRTFFQGTDSPGNAFWNVSCARGESFQLMIQNNATGSTKMLNCRFIKAIGGSPCFVKFRR